MQRDPNPQAKLRLQPTKTTIKPIKNPVMGEIFFPQRNKLLNILFYQSSWTSVNNLPSVKKWWICAAPHGRAPRTLVAWVKPESRQADKMWNSWRGQEGKFQTNIRTCGGSGGVESQGGFRTLAGPSELNRFFDASYLSKFTILTPLFGLNSAKSKWFQWK